MKFDSRKPRNEQLLGEIVLTTGGEEGGGKVSSQEETRCHGTEAGSRADVISWSTYFVTGIGR